MWLSLLGTLTLFASAGVVQLPVTLVSLSLPYTLITVGGSSFWAHFLPSHSLPFLPLKQRVCSQTKKATMAI